MDSDTDSDREKSSDPNEELLSSDDKTFHDDVDEDSSPDDDNDIDDDNDENSSDVPIVQVDEEQLLVVLMQTETEAIQLQQQQPQLQQHRQQEQQIDVKVDVMSASDERQSALIEVATAIGQKEPLLAKYRDSVRESVECFYSAQDLLEYGHMLSSSNEQRTPDVESGYFDKSESDDVSREEFEAISSSLRRRKEPQLGHDFGIAVPSSSESLRIELNRFCSSLEAFEIQRTEQEEPQEQTSVLLKEQLEKQIETVELTTEEQFVDTQSEPYIMQVYRLGKCLENVEL